MDNVVLQYHKYLFPEENTFLENNTNGDIQMQLSRSETGAWNTFLVNEENSLS